MLKVDLHTHSSVSPDGGITADQYATALEDNTLDYIAITDHDTITAAEALNKSLGERIIIGEEITTLNGELIGLFLHKVIPPGQTALKTAQAIKQQGGLVYVPHPFETVRKGISQTDLEHIAELVDIVEVYNGRALLQNRGPEATTWARMNGKVAAASSDAHGLKGIGSAYSGIKNTPRVGSLVESLRLAHLNMRRPPLKTLLYPKRNRLLKKFTK